MCVCVCVCCQVLPGKKGQRPHTPSPMRECCCCVRDDAAACAAADVRLRQCAMCDARESRGGCVASFGSTQRLGLCSGCSALCLSSRRRPRCMKSPGGPPWSMWLPLTGNICINAFIQLFAFAPRLHAFDTFSLLVAVLCARANSCVCVCVCVSVWGSECALFSLARGRFHGGQVTVSGQFSTG